MMLVFPDLVKIKNFNTSKLFVFVAIFGMFMPRLVKKGMFGDGLLYASISRNMAEGRGSMWKPFFSSSYWLENIPDAYFENPPLMIWIQATFFYFLGDYWWVEKFFCVCVFCINIWLFKHLWETLYHKEVSLQKYWFSSVFWWYCIPVVIWGNVNNLMDNMLFSFCLSAIVCILKGHFYDDGKKYYWYILGSVAIFAGTLTKGPVAVYPFVIPFLLLVCGFTYSWRDMFKSSSILIGISGMLFLVMIFAIPDSQEFFSQYWEQRLKAVILGTRDDMIVQGWKRLYIVKQLCVELFPIVILTVGILGIIKLKKLNFLIDPKVKKMSLFFVLLGCSATLPILFSTKQSGIYLIPGIPMFAIAASIFTTPLLDVLFSRISNTHFLKYFNVILTIICIVIVGITMNNFGKYGREEELIHDTEVLMLQIPPYEKIGVCPEMMEEFVLHTYLQRMGKFELCDYLKKPNYIFLDHFCIPNENENFIATYTKLQIPGLLYFTVYQKNQ